MRPGGPAMDCETAQLLAQLNRPGAAELDAREAGEFMAHLAECPRCRAFAGTLGRADQQTALAMRSVPMPEGLRVRIVARLAASARRRRRWAWTGVAAAAAAVFAAVVYVRSRPEAARPGVDLAAAYRDLVQQVGSKPQAVSDWFDIVHHVRVACPMGFDYRLLVFYDLAEFQGQRVPLLLFARGDASARVYVLAARDFNLDDVAPAPGYSVRLLRHPTEAETAYVVAYTGESLGWFLSRAEEPRTADADAARAAAETE